jgi:hypothetical protein
MSKIFSDANRLASLKSEIEAILKEYPFRRRLSLAALCHSIGVLRGNGRRFKSTEVCVPDDQNFLHR